MRRAPRYESPHDERCALISTLDTLEDMSYRLPVWSHGRILRDAMRVTAERLAGLCTPEAEIVTTADMRDEVTAGG